MRVVCPFIPRRIQDATRESITRLAPECEYVDVSGETPLDDHAYSRLLAGLWRSGGDFVLIEHDIVLHADVLPGFERCEREWCNHAYGMGLGGRMWDGIGCVRFRGSLTRRTPWLADFFALTVWRGLDQAVFDALSDQGLFGAHHHWPMVGHSHAHGEHDDDLRLEEPGAVLPRSAPLIVATRVPPHTEALRGV